MKKYFNLPIFFGSVGLILIALVGYSNFAANRQIAQEVGSVAESVQSQQQSINNLNNLPANQSALALAVPGAVTVKVTPDSSAPVLGNSNAKVAVIEFADFQCPFCEKFFTDTEPEIISKYVDSGQVKFIFEDFPFLGQESENAAEAAKCAQVQGQFWPYHDYLYSHQSPKGENTGGFSIPNLEAFAKVVPGIDSSKFNACLSTHQEMTAVQGELSSANSIGVQNTPTIFINGREAIGVYPTATYEQIIDSALAAAK